MDNSWQNTNHISDLLSGCRRRFGELLRDLCEASGLSQLKLAQRAQTEYGHLIESGLLQPDTNVGSLMQPTVSKVIAGIQAPTYFQVLIWLRVLREYYASTELAALCAKHKVDVPVFSVEMEQTLWSLAAFVPPEKVLKTTAEAPKVCSRRELIDHKERRFEQKVGIFAEK